MVKVAIDKVEENETARPAAAKRKPAPRKSRWLLKLSLLSMAAVAAAPSVISTSGKAPDILKKLHPELAQAVEFRTLTMHWWAPVQLTELQIRDLSQIDKDHPIADAPLLCKVDHVTTIEPLWRIAMNAGRGTGVLVKSPHLTLVSDENGTNIDRTIVALFGESKDSSASTFPFRVTVENGTVELRSSLAAGDSEALLTSVESALDELPEAVRPADQAPVFLPSEIAATVSSINGTFSTMDTERWLPEMKLTASIHQQNIGLTSQSKSGDAVPRPTRLAAGLDDIVSDFPNVPLEDLAGTDEAGDPAGARIQIHLKPRADEKGRQTIQIGARDVDLRLLQPFLSMLGLDASCDGMISGGIDARLAGASLKEGLVGRLLLQGDNVRLRQQSWATDEWLNLGKVDANGAVAIAEDGLLIQDLKIQSDLAELTGSGELRHRAAMSESSDPESQQVQIQGAVDLAKLASSLRSTLAIHEDVVIQRGRMTFGLRASAGSGKEIAFLTSPTELSDLVAVSSAATSSALQVVSAAGQNVTPVQSVAMTSREITDGRWQLVVKTEDLAAVRGGKPLTVDSSLRLDAVGPFSGGIPELLKARLTADFGTIDCVPDKAAWKISGLVQPATLWQQLQQFADIPQPGLRGDVSFQTRLALQGETIQLTDLQLNSSDVKASSIALAMTPSNPVTSMLDGTVHIEGTGAALRTLVAPWHDASWLSERSNVVTDLTATPTREIQLSVKISPENMANVQRSNVLSVSRSNGRPVIATQVTRAAMSASSSFVIDEADIDLSLLAKNAGQQFELKKGTVRLPGLNAVVAGVISVPDNDLMLDVTADTTYDLDILSRRLFAADSGLSFSGQGRDVFQLKGRPSALSGVSTRGIVNPNAANASALTGSGTVNWASADVLGLQVGQANVQASLDNSLLRTAPIRCSLNGGELNIMPQYDLASSRMQLGTGSRVQNMKITPELCRTWLGFVAPMLADTAEVNGEVSARVDRFLWDFNVPENSDVVAQLTIHQAEASPGSSLASLLQVAELLRKSGSGGSDLASRSLVLPEQTIPVQIRQGLVAHEGLIMELSGYRLTTSGIVGLNKQLQMTIDFPLEKSTATASGRSVKIPLRGTITQPQPDTGALLQNLGTQKIQEKLGGEVDKTLNKQLNKLFDKF